MQWDLICYDLSESPFFDIEGNLPTELSFSDSTSPQDQYCLGSSSLITAGLVEPGQHSGEPGTPPLIVYLLPGESDGPLLRVILPAGEPVNSSSKKCSINPEFYVQVLTTTGKGPTTKIIIKFLHTPV